VKLSRVRPKLFVHLAGRVPHNTAHSATPAGVYGGNCVVLFVYQQNGEAVRSFDCHEMSGSVFQQSIGIAQDASPATRRDADIRMDLVQGGNLAVLCEIGRMARAETMHQPRELIKRTGTVNVLRISVKHYAGF